MGFLEKYAAYRWVSSGDPDSGGGGGTALVVIFLVFGAIFGGLLVLNFVASSVIDAIFTYVRPIFLIAPDVTPVVAALPIVAVLALLPGYERETAERILAPNGSSTWFYVKSVLLISFINLYVYGLSTGFRRTLQESGHPVLGSGAFYAVWTVAIFYWIYKFFHLPYRYHRLIRHAPKGYLLSVIFSLPIVTSAIVVLLRVPIFYAESGVSFALALNSAFVLGVLFVKFGAEPRILGSTTAPQSAASSGPESSPPNAVEDGSRSTPSEGSDGSKPPFYRS